MLRRIILLLTLAVALTAAAPASAPVNVSYVYSDSMEPTIQQYDGFVLVPTTDVEQGDVVTFQAEQRGELVTHRVVDRDSAGFVTRGDDNPSTDQASGYTYVTRADIVGEVLSVGGQPLVIPNLGLVVRFLNRHLAVTMAVLLGLLGLDLRRDGVPTRSTDTTVTRTGDVLDVSAAAAFAAIVVLTLLGGMTVGQAVVVTEPGSGGDRTVTVGETATRNVSLRSSTSPFTYTIASAEGLQVVDRQHTGTTFHVRLRIPPQPAVGVYRGRLSVYSYPTTLPRGAVRWLHDVHPVVAALGTAGAAVAPLYLLGLLLVGRRTPVRWSRSRSARRLAEE